MVTEQRAEALGVMPKSAIADRILDEVKVALARG
jgi:hypothetical protein